MSAVLIEVEPMRFLAGIALGSGMRLVTAHFDEVTAVIAAKLDLYAAIALAEDARRGLPLRVGCADCLGVR
jgi:hypothetical protein